MLMRHIFVKAICKVTHFYLTLLETHKLKYMEETNGKKEEEDNDIELVVFQEQKMERHRLCKCATEL